MIDLAGPPHNLDPRVTEYELDFPTVLLLYARTRQWNREQDADRLEQSLIQSEGVAHVNGFRSDERQRGFKRWYESIRREVKNLRAPEGSLEIRKMSPQQALVMLGQTQVDAMKASGEYYDRVQEPETESAWE